MPIQCRLVELPGDRHSPTDPKPGDMWFWKNMPEGDDLEYYKRHLLSPDYVNNHLGKRKPLCVTLPSGETWCIDLKSSRGTDGWTVTGEAPNVTARPSIMTNLYHGWLTNGELSDDLEGRTYASS